MLVLDLVELSLVSIMIGGIGIVVFAIHVIVFGLKASRKAL